MGGGVRGTTTTTTTLSEFDFITLICMYVMAPNVGRDAGKPHQRRRETKQKKTK